MSTLIDFKAGGTVDFGTTLTMAVDFGSGADRCVLIEAFSYGDALAGTGIPISSVVIDPTGANINVTLSAEVTSTNTSILYQRGRIRHGAVVSGALPTGIKDVVMTIQNANARPQMAVMTRSGVTAISAEVFNYGLNAFPTATISSAAGREVVALAWGPTTADTTNFIASSPATASHRKLSTDSYGIRGSLLTEAGAASVVIDATMKDGSNVNVSEAWAVTAWSLTGVAATGPTINTQPTAQTANEGATATYTVAASGTGALSYQWKRQPPVGGAFANVGANSSTYTTATLDCATDHGANVYCAVSDSNGTTNTSTVGLTVRAVTTTSRPVADVDTAGWTASTGTDFFALIDETTYSLTDYIDSPTITASPDWVTFVLSYPRATGDHVIPVWASVPGGTGTLRVRLENDSATVVGSAADQAVTGTATLYELPITISGPATRVSYAFVT